MGWEFRLGDVTVSLCHGHSKENASKGRVYNSGGNLFNERVKTVKVKYGQNPVRESSERHSQWYTEISWQVMWCREGVIALGSSDIMKETDQFLTDQVFLKEREVLYGMEDGGIGEDGGVERMGGKGG